MSNKNDYGKNCHEQNGHIFHIFKTTNRSWPSMLSVYMHSSKVPPLLSINAHSPIPKSMVRWKPFAHMEDGFIFFENIQSRLVWRMKYGKSSVRLSPWPHIRVSLHWWSLTTCRRRQWVYSLHPEPHTGKWLPYTELKISPWCVRSIYWKQLSRWCKTISVAEKTHYFGVVQTRWRINWWRGHPLSYVWYATGWNRVNLMQTVIQQKESFTLVMCTSWFFGNFVQMPLVLLLQSLFFQFKWCGRAPSFYLWNSFQ